MDAHADALLPLTDDGVVGGSAAPAEISILAADSRSVEEKVLERCSKTEIVPFADLYSAEVLSKSKKVIQRNILNLKTSSEYFSFKRKFYLNKKS